MKVAIIPARGGSKRIPRKNIKTFCGKPMIAWSIEAARSSGCFDEIIVSTDDDEIAEVARGLGASVPFVRPDDLSNDNAGTMVVVQHALEWLRKEGRHVKYVCCLYATAPFVTGALLRAGLAYLESGDCDYAFAVTSFPFPIQRAIRIDSHGRVEMFCPDHATTRSQDLEPAYHDAGQFYWGRAEAWWEARKIFGAGTRPILLPRHWVQDIDTEEDWARAEWLFRALLNAGERDEKV